MRKIKFRLWTGKRFRTDDFFIQDGRVFEMSDFDGPKELKGILQQYTGLKDKNGKEIYEGDLVANDNCFGCSSSWGIEGGDNFPCMRVVIEEAPCFRLAYTEPQYRDKAVSGYTFTEGNQRLFEVIGNIYENEDILK